MIKLHLSCTHNLNRTSRIFHKGIKNKSRVTTTHGNIAVTMLLAGIPEFSAAKLATSWWTAALAMP